VKRADIPTIRRYDLHHADATLLLAADEHVKAASEHLGHENLTITPKHCPHVSAVNT